MTKITLTGSVGKNGKNQAKDVKAACALINTYLRHIKATPLPISEKSSTTLEQTIAQFQKNHLKVAKPDSLISVSGRSIDALNKLLSSVFKAQAISKPSPGHVTWDSEGTEGGRYHSRKLHVPSGASGLTLGRGYDLRRKSVTTLQSDLIAAGLDTKYVAVLTKAVGLSGASAKQFIIDNDMLDFQISITVQKALFDISYKFEASEVKRICGKSDVVKLYGKTERDKLNSKIKEITVDLKFRGDYTSSARKLIQKAIADNDLSSFKKVIIDQKNWANVPKDRFDRRVKFLS